MDPIQFFDLVRVAAYSVAAVGLIFFALDDYNEDRRTAIIWAAMAFQNVMVLALLALDMSAAVAWMEARYLLTPSAVFAAVAIGYNTVVRAQEMLQTSREERNVEVTQG
jgi:hypothetical protein